MQECSIKAKLWSYSGFQKIKFMFCKNKSQTIQGFSPRHRLECAELCVSRVKYFSSVLNFFYCAQLCDHISINRVKYYLLLFKCLEFCAQMCERISISRGMCQQGKLLLAPFQVSWISLIVKNHVNGYQSLLCVSRVKYLSAFPTQF